jgi:K+-transporting ATPase c subunit
VAVACLFLAAKVEESAIRLKDIVNKYYEVRHCGIFPEESVSFLSLNLFSLVTVSLLRLLKNFIKN